MSFDIGQEDGRVFVGLEVGELGVQVGDVDAVGGVFDGHGIVGGGAGGAGAFGARGEEGEGVGVRDGVGEVGGAGGGGGGGGAGDGDVEARAVGVWWWC